jgi:ABC-type molybdenum transport system ATPase subunit/photorepair protein PhrA
MPARLSRAARDVTPKEAPSQISATPQQSRFHLASIEGDTTAIDLETVCIATGEHEVIVDASLRIKEGVRYGLIGRNGCGKSSEHWCIVWADPVADW